MQFDEFWRRTTIRQLRQVELKWRPWNDLVYAQNPLHTFPRNFPRMDGEVATKCYRLELAPQPTSPQQVVIMEFGKRHDKKDTTDFCPRELVTDLLRGNWCNGFWSLLYGP